MSSASFGSPSSSIHHRVHPSSSKPTSPTHGVVTTTDPKSSTTLSSTSSSRTTNTNNHAVSLSSLPPTTITPSTSSHPHRQPKFPHDVASASNPAPAAPRPGKKNITYRHSTGQSEPPRTRHEVINLVDSDTEANSSRRPSNPSLASSARNRSSLQPPYDPIPRGSTGSSTKSAHRASASPSISSLIDPQPPPAQLSAAPEEKPITISTSVYATSAAEKNVMKVENVPRSGDGVEPSNRSPKSKAGTAPPSAAASPKPHRPAAPSSSGNGLLSGVLPGAPTKDTETHIPNIHIHVPLNGEHNKYINFTKLAEERYGWAALNPRLAKARERMMRADNSGDEMMVDGSESESNVEMDKPMGGTDSAAEGGKKMRKKRKNQDIYDKNDPFIDDTEMLWEEQAAASKDGFFVYSGPLVPEGEKPQIERYNFLIRYFLIHQKNLS